MIGHNEIVQLLEDIATNHYQIRGFGFGDPWEYLASETPKTPIMWGMLGNTSRSDIEVTYNYKLLVMDLVKRDESDENEVLTDTQKIIFDVIAQLNSNTYYNEFYFSASSSLEPFTERFDNSVSGWAVDISFRVPSENDPCQVPTSGTPTLNGTYTTILDQNNNIVSLVPCGGYYSVIVASGIDEGSSTNTTYSNAVIDI